MFDRSGQIIDMTKRSVEAIAAAIRVQTVGLLALFAELREVADHEYVFCRNCHRPIEVGTGAASRRRRYCDDRCRVAASRMRKRA
jgi:hypothetical protein